MISPRAMIIEDEAAIANIVEIVLQEAQFETERVPDGQQALERLALTVPDLVVLDLHLPHVSGETILSYIRTNNQFAQTRVILTTADRWLAETLRPQANGVLIKPFSISQLSDLARQLR